MGALADFQADFWAALVAPASGGAVTGLAAMPGFAVYRNTALKACLDALEANYPSLVRLLGEDCLRAVAADYVAAHPPRSAVLADYGDGFPAHLAGLGDLAEWPWLSAVAKLDRAWTEAHLASDAPFADASALGRLTPAALGAVILPPHPTARWLWSPEWPIHAIWQAQRVGIDVPVAWVPEGALITRRLDAIEFGPASRAECAFLDACAARHTVAEAAGASLALEPQTDLSALMARLLQRGALGVPVCPPHVTLYEEQT